MNYIPYIRKLTLVLIIAIITSPFIAIWNSPLLGLQIGASAALGILVCRFVYQTIKRKQTTVQFNPRNRREKRFSLRIQDRIARENLTKYYL